MGRIYCVYEFNGKYTAERVTSIDEARMYLTAIHKADTGGNAIGYMDRGGVSHVFEPMELVKYVPEDQLAYHLKWQIEDTIKLHLEELNGN